MTSSWSGVILSGSRSQSNAVRIDEHAALLTNQFLRTGGRRNLTKFFFLLNTSSRFSTRLPVLKQR